MKYTHKSEWLPALPLDTLQPLLVRYALRSFPAISPDTTAEGYDKEFFLLHARSLLTTCCALVEPSTEILHTASYVAFSVGDFKADKMQTAASIACSAAAEVLFLRNREHAKQVAFNAIEALPFTDFGAQAQWDLAEFSDNPDPKALFLHSLWTIWLQLSDKQQQIAFPKEYQEFTWPRFWREWYQGFLDGKPLDWELQRRVALIDDAIWKAGPEAVAKEIERIQAEMLDKKLPMAEHIEVNPDTGKFHAIPIPVENPTTLSALLSQIEDELEDCLGGHNGLAERSGTVKKLNRVLTKYKDDPQNAELTLTRVAGSLRSQLHETKELADNEDNLALLDAVEEGVRGIRANHPEVAKNREQLAQQAIHALTPEDKVLLQQALPVLAEISEPDLADDFATDIPELINDALLPLPAGAPPLPGSDATTRVFSRVSKMAIAAEQGAKILDSNEIKTVRLAHLGYTALELFYSLVQIGLRILGVL